MDKQSIKERKKLWEILKTERQNGNHAVIRQNVLYVNGKKYIQMTNEKDNTKYNNLNKPPQTPLLTSPTKKRQDSEIQSQDFEENRNNHSFRE